MENCEGDKWKRESVREKRKKRRKNKLEKEKIKKSRG